ncbi:MAG: HD domain-containing phosphohydrolase [Pseudomonadota bacterium]
MRRALSFNMGNLLLSFSDAMNLGSPALVRQQQRTAYIAWQIGKTVGLSANRLKNIFTAALLHDIGAFSDEEKLKLRNLNTNDLELHCIRGARLLEKVPCLLDAAKIVRVQHRKWTEWNQPIDAELVLEAQVLGLSDYIEHKIQRDQYILHQDRCLINEIVSLKGKSFHPQVVESFMSVAGIEEFWLDLVSPRLYALLLHDGPYGRFEVDLAGMSALAQLCRSVIDFRSPFTVTHSTGVAACAQILSKIFGLTETEVKLMEIAGSFHDLGKLAVPNSILDKPDVLTKEEFALVKAHTYYTFSILGTIDGFQQIAEWAAYHHERLSGSGYPYHCTDSELSTGSRIMMVADVFTALAEDRPYRKGMVKDDILRIMNGFASSRILDPGIIKTLIENYDEVCSYAMERQTDALESYKQHVSSPKSV